MADPEDLKLFQSGETDLQRCDLSSINATGKTFKSVDFRSCNLKGTDFSGSSFTECDFTDANLVSANFHQALFVRCIFNRALYRVKFDEATFQGGKFSGIATKCSFLSTKFYNVDVSGLMFSDGNIFDESTSAVETDFHGVAMPRSLARERIFENYVFERGKLTSASSEGSPETELKMAEKEDALTSQEAISVTTAFRSNPTGAQLMCLSLSKAIDEFITNTPTPNDPDRLSYHQEYVSLLEFIKEHINKIADDLSEIAAGNVNEKIKDAKNSVISLRNAIQSWWDNNNEKAVHYGTNIGLLGVGTAFLTFCGAPPAMATGICAVLGGSKPVIDYLKESKGSE